jgi:hypothetical protein
MRRMLFPMPEAVGSKRRVDEDVTMDVDEQAVSTAAGFGQEDKVAPLVSAAASVPKPIILVNEVESFLVEPTSSFPTLLEEHDRKLRISILKRVASPTRGTTPANAASDTTTKDHMPLLSTLDAPALTSAPLASDATTPAPVTDADNHSKIEAPAPLAASSAADSASTAMDTTAHVSTPSPVTTLGLLRIDPNPRVPSGSSPVRDLEVAQVLAEALTEADVVFESDGITIVDKSGAEEPRKIMANGWRWSREVIKS